MAARVASWTHGPLKSIIGKALPSLRLSTTVTPLLSHVHCFKAGVSSRDPENPTGLVGEVNFKRVTEFPGSSHFTPPVLVDGQ